MKATIGVLVFTLCAATAFAQGAQKAAAPAMDKTAIEKALIANEQKINDAVVKGDLATFKAMVADDGWSVDEMGANSVVEFEKMLKPGIAKITDMKLDMFKILWVDANTAVVTYTWTGKGTYMDMPVKSPTLASTVYTKRGEKWLAIFHQETPKAPAPPPAPKKK